jgi:hypothetical protein
MPKECAKTIKNRAGAFGHLPPLWLNTEGLRAFSVFLNLEGVEMTSSTVDFF